MNRLTAMRTTLVSCFVVALLLLPSCGGSGKGEDLRLRPADAVMFDHSPFEYETGVALQREIELYFSQPIEPSSLDRRACTVLWGETELNVRLHVGADRRHAKVFPEVRWPSGANLVVRLDGKFLRSANGRRVDVDRNQRIGGKYEFSFRTLDTTRVAGTDVCGRVFASEMYPAGTNPDSMPSLPIPGVVVRVDGVPGLFATTDDSGNFYLRDVPAGEFFVHVDGTTAKWAPYGMYFPNVGKSWIAEPGKLNFVGDVYLPGIAFSTLQPVSQTAPTSIRMSPEQLAAVPDPELRQQLMQVELTVPADSLFWDDGRRGGMVGIAPVNSDRLPGALPPDLRFPLVITVQTDGAENFDQPAGLAFPNLGPDPVPPGGKTALWSFNHDTGRFEVVGPMTASQDGTMLYTDPGVGIRAPGWHGVSWGSWFTSLLAGDCESGSCFQRTQCKLASQFYGVASSTVACLGKMRSKGMLVALGKVSDIAKAGATMYTELMKIGRHLLNEEFAALANPCRSLRDGHDAFNTARQIIRDRHNNEPGFGFDDWMRCADVLTQTARTFCIAGGMGHGIPEGCPRNDRSAPAWAANVCRKVDLAVTGLEFLTGFRQFYQSLTEGYQLGVVIDICNAINLGIGYWQNHGISAAEREFLDALIDSVMPTLRAIYDSVSVVDQAIETAKQVQQSMRGVVGDIEPSMGVLSPKPGNFHYYVATSSVGFGSGDVQRFSDMRGKTNGSGVVSANVAPDSEFVVGIYDPFRNEISMGVGVTAGNGQRTRANPGIFFSADGLPDTDGDGLCDLAEEIVGINPRAWDTDGDGISDLDELLAGTDPTGGLPGDATSRATRAPAIDLCLDRDHAVVATGSALSVFNVFQGMAPVLVAEVELGSAVTKVACGGGFAAAALAAGGLTIVDLRDLRAPRVLGTLQTGSRIQALAMAGSLVYAGDESGQMLEVDAPSVLMLRNLRTEARPSASDGILDIAVLRDHAYLIDEDELFTVDLRPGELTLAHRAAARLGRMPLASLCVDIDKLYVVRRNGFDVWSLANPQQPARLPPDGNNNTTTERGWKQLVSDGGGHLIAAVGTDLSLSSGQHRVGLYDSTQPGVNWLRYFDVGDKALALRMHCGLIYIADGAAGLTVLRYLGVDRNMMAPSVTLDLGNQTLVAGQRAWALALASDDWQVRHVELWVDGEPIATDCAWPFEFRWQVPLDRASTELELRVHDSAGNWSRSGPIQLWIQPDLQAPRVLHTMPVANGIATGPGPALVAAWFDEDLDPATLTAQSFFLQRGGTAVPADGLEYRGEQRLALLRFAHLPEGQHLATLTADIRDRSSNTLQPFQWSFTVGDYLPGWRMRCYILPWAGGAVAPGTLRGELANWFANMQPSSFTRHEAGSSAQEVAVSTVPNVDFPGDSSGWFSHAGPDGTLQTVNRNQPLGDDIIFSTRSAQLPGGSATFGVLFEGLLLAPVSGTVRFRVPLDDGYRLEIDGVVVGEYTTGLSTATRYAPPQQAPLLQLSSGVHSVRLLYYNGGGAGRLQLEVSEGTIFPLNTVLAPMFFYHPR